MNKFNFDRIGIGLRIKELRGKRSQEEFGKMIGVSYQMIRLYENGKSLSFDVLDKICTVYETPISQVLGFKPLNDDLKLSSKVLEVATILNSLDESYQDHYNYLFTCIKRKIEDFDKHKSIGHPLGRVNKSQ